MEKQPLILSHLRDNVATARSVVRTGTMLQLSERKKIIAREEIPFGHKISLRRISRGGGVIKYGVRIGRATRTIEPGELVHIHNVIGERGKRRRK